jgi:dihydrofolate synthase/folylpolyglutamate synthase
MKPGLERVEFLLQTVGNPHKRFRIVQVAGTNGKGSTSTMIASILVEHELRTGLFTSPHVIDFTERFVVNNSRATPDRIVSVIERLKPAADKIEATFFEIATAAATVLFAEENVDIAVVEVGMGGAMDATSALDSALSVITSVAVDHTHVLGASVTEIAGKKAGIIRTGGVVVSGATGDALGVIRDAAATRGARFISVAEETEIDRVSVISTGSIFDLAYDATVYNGLSISLLGRHQVANAACAAVVAHELSREGMLDLSEMSLRRGLGESGCVGRMQILDRRPTVVADVAHNPDAANVLVAAVREVFEYDSVVVVLGVMADKDLEGIVSAISDVADFVILTRPSSVRAADPAELAKIAQNHRLEHEIVESPGAAVARALSLAHEADLVLITGSHYTVGDVMISLGIGDSL